MHFKLDEHMPIRLKKYIERLGYKCSTVFEESLMGKDDKELINICKKEFFVLVTLDNDFSNIISFPTDTHHGIILLKTKKQGADSVIGLFDKLNNRIDISISKNSILIFDGNTVKIRK